MARLSEACFSTSNVVERARRYTPVTAGVVLHQRAREPEYDGDLRSWFEMKRRDPEWGFGGGRSRYN